MIQGEYFGYFSSLDCFLELKVYYGFLKVNLQLFFDMVFLEFCEIEFFCEFLNLDLSIKLEIVYSVQDLDNFLLKIFDLVYMRCNNFYEKINEGCIGVL